MTAPLTVALAAALNKTYRATFPHANPADFASDARFLTAHLRADPELQEALAAALHPELWDDTIDHSEDSAFGCGNMDRQSVRRILDRLTSENSEGETP